MFVEHYNRGFKDDFSNILNVLKPKSITAHGQEIRQ